MRLLLLLMQLQRKHLLLRRLTMRLMLRLLQNHR
jgi:hypothetical protein